MFYRNILKNLQVWAESDYRKVLILRGARQVGKTTAVRMFSAEFDTFIELNMEIPEEKDIFDHFTNIQNLYNHILLKKQTKSQGERILLFIDEIQNSANAIRSLRFFYEQMPSLYVIASGSILDIYLYKEKFEISVGRIDYLWMYPISFDEYLIASGNYRLLEEVQQKPIPEYIYPIIREHFLTYALIGGMPEAVKIWLDTKDIVQVQGYLDSLLQAYRDDVVKYAQTSDQALIIRHIMDTAFSEVCKQISFEGFGSSSYRSQAIKNAFQILERASIVTLLYPYTTMFLPAIPKRSKRPKLLFLDIGILNHQAKVMVEYFSTKSLDSIYKGTAMELLVGQMLTVMKAKQGFDFSFWKRDVRGSSAEIDYVIIYKGKMIPIEVKAGKTGTLKSLMLFMDKAPHNFAVRIYDGNYAVEELSTSSGKTFKLINIPLSLTFRLIEFIDSM